MKNRTLVERSLHSAVLLLTSVFPAVVISGTMEGCFGRVFNDN